MSQAPTAAPSSWIPLELLAQRFAANLQKLSERNPALADSLRTHVPARRYHIQPLHDHVLLGASGPTGQIEALPQALAPESSQNLVRQLYPSGQCDQPVLVAG